MSNVVLTVEGMTCGHCKMRVENSLKALAGVESVDVDLASKKVSVSGTADREAMVQAITDAGYQVVA